ncbi:lytic transglycosylase domain-containing protein [Entomobacter blattae]|uniref:Transglycosylase SLT domain protein n=1 Tax=Entomobacter blattae TaxID=2762277 RepID=A0A7H1NRR0_9PROT|nr:lytic transglycosylase domain-containing protein [Entomobacter blattae]QNT77554.1 Transglycosylase SLT domain protein [Entomobacter blattae]QNT78470.1 Transglycosylase SLT domain protein [Entomobacter blattae]
MTKIPINGMRLPTLTLSMLAIIGLLFPASGSKAHSREIISLNVLQKARNCSVGVHPLTTAYLIKAESGDNQYAVHVNGRYKLPRQPQNMQEAQSTFDWLSTHRLNFDAGYMQVNSANFRSLGLDRTSVFKSCENIRGGTKILAQCYNRAVSETGSVGQKALRKALSCYNTGNTSKGFTNGYVGKLVQLAAANVSSSTLMVPALLASPRHDTDGVPERDGDTVSVTTDHQDRSAQKGGHDVFASSDDNDAFTSKVVTPPASVKQIASPSAKEEGKDHD